MTRIAAAPYSSFGITVDRKRELKWLFSQEKATLHTVNEDHTNSETARENFAESSGDR
jgi:hypothetical protein